MAAQHNLKFNPCKNNMRTIIKSKSAGLTVKNHAGYPPAMSRIHCLIYGVSTSGDNILSLLHPDCNYFTNNNIY